MATLIAHNHSHEDVWNKYSLIEIRAYYTEARLREVQNFSDACTSSRIVNAENKSYKEFTETLKQSVNEMRAQVENENLDLQSDLDMTSEKGASNFFSQIQSFMKTANKKPKR